MNLKPIGQQILLHLPKQSESIKGGIYVPSSIANDGPTQAEVIALGSGMDAKGKFTPFNVKVGDKVLLPRYAQGVVLKENDETYCVTTEEGLLGIVEESS